ncbi:exopolysaccharide biosynthesis polyprenyl glycosylphosphotransferase [candidate division KSB3 bacterium]|uniref:Exopolysaccharide biosynthesis polyprenyl glycosylphosphotransferase n=1 Tax=candidate division KSB3 bacterium TaxID=2044937 RepID=A0A9D5K0P7_9BACT|nr:exopolysaccharide biosynthesis polyprenyl glycosylphosphotransferase [candidate division KSB3 bacterium]MBD3327633.1 exopolysaccharide biosynthesis polyprenyl glycosylphosphotransferase [candidate division KSB3 bacterium]
MIRERISLIIKLYALIDLGVITVSFLLAYVLRCWLAALLPIPPLMEASEYFPLLVSILPIWMGLLYINKTYTSQRGKTITPLIWKIIKANLEGVCVLSLLFFVLKLHMFNRSLVFLFVLLSMLLLTTEKLILFRYLRYMRKRGKNIKRVLMVGIDPKVQVLTKRIEQHPETGFVIAGFLAETPEDVGRRMYGYNVIGTCEDLSQVLHEEIIDEVIFAMPLFRLHRIKSSLEICEQMGINCRIVIDTHDYSPNFKLFVDNMLDLPLISFSYREKQFLSLGVKRLMDITVAATLLIGLAPIFLLIAGLIKRQSPGPAIFRQVRSGLNGRRFVMYKFRTMIDGAETLRAELDARNEVSGPIFKMERDPRITRIGRYLRKTSLDELPQLWNVLIGEMSLVGPRPLPLIESSQITGYERRRLSMKPGITGMWQCNGRSHCHYDDLICLDLDYVDNWSLLLDLKLLIKTIPIVIRCVGAM